MILEDATLVFVSAPNHEPNDRMKNIQTSLGENVISKIESVLSLFHKN